MKILRRFRYYFLEENKFRKYTLYAIGEIVLIVIGILIALQLNNLNEDRIDRERERIYLTEYLNDLEDCRTDLRQKINRTYEAFINTDTLLNLIRGEELDIDADHVNDLMMNPYRWSTFAGSDGTVSEILNGGNLLLIRNPDIRSSIASWYANLREIQAFEVVLRDFVQDYYSFLVNYLEIEVSEIPDPVMAGLQANTPFKSYRKTITKSKLMQLSDHLKFINLMDDIRWRQKHLNGLYIRKEKEFDLLMETIRLELQDFN